ncbi:hypothetical protein [Streptomyces acidiscabies]|uniref:Uncharacterized protein n=1 Tax=Streptomyces acidiscabies TaxID=42234 RepID=A0ABU4LX14_9ACTN|nr:hypothetical protein [Streptomyces acidiscabies]MDX3020101.1 hypothetical protein [Streptomyces acidiscabies]
MAEPAHPLSRAAEYVRQFNHTSRAADTGWEHPDASNTALGALSHLVSMLPQALTQATDPVMQTYAHGRVAIDGGGTRDQAVKHMRIALDNAKKTAEFLNEAVQQVHTTLDTVKELAELLDDSVEHLHSITSIMGLDRRGLPELGD